MSNGVTQVYSLMSKSVVNIKSFGFFKLCFSGLGPDDSDFIACNDKPIDLEMLERLLAFELDPTTLKPIDDLFRIHHKAKQLPLFNESAK